MNFQSSDQHRIRLAFCRILAMVVGIFVFVVALELLESSPNRGLWTFVALTFWGFAAIIGVLFAPKWLANVYREKFTSK